jgi:hypothetical protein
VAVAGGINHGYLTKYLGLDWEKKQEKGGKWKILLYECQSNSLSYQLIFFFLFFFLMNEGMNGLRRGSALFKTGFEGICCSCGKL